jgi:ABC-type branched-subunit amino acid transport system ATPase component
LSEPPALECKRVSKRFGAIQAVHPISLRVEGGERVAVIGPNGAGKTTLFALIAGELQTDEGAVLLAGRDVTRASPQARARLGLGRTFQSARLFAEMSVAENYDLALLAAGKRGVAGDALAEVGLASNGARPAGELAQGERKRLELAMVLAGEPKVLLLDEPTAGMGREERTELMELIVTSVERRTVTVVFTEHDIGAVFDNAQRVVVLDRGEQIADGPPELVRKDRRVREVYLGGEEAE